MSILDAIKETLSTIFIIFSKFNKINFIIWYSRKISRALYNNELSVIFRLDKVIE
ncbi:MAG: hypothetical protein MSS16_01010 [Streptococcus orisratti]|uniref:hypothetical protein n=1 Tax=Streptococcus orisratti TaxID=114652 RepID=UPI0023531460|nr:hypothetical protein [Streptococcus orisratti]MCI7676673.1 hypothetical protein [Streptococcus orisratti]